MPRTFCHELHELTRIIREITFQLPGYLEFAGLNYFAGLILELEYINAAIKIRKVDCCSGINIINLVHLFTDETIYLKVKRLIVAMLKIEDDK